MTDGGSSIPAVQALLHTLATGRRVAEIGTAFGEGAVAMAATVELDPERAEAARVRLDGCTNVELLVGDWRELLPRGDRSISSSPTEGSATSQHGRQPSRSWRAAG